MQPNNQFDYWKNNPSTGDLPKSPEPTAPTAPIPAPVEEPEKLEMYSPEPAAEEPNPVNDIKSVQIDDNDPEPDEADDSNPVHWSALESVDNEKNAIWYILFAVALTVLLAIDIFYIKSITFGVLLAAVAVAIIVYSLRPAQEIDYTLSGNKGLYIGDKLYFFAEFKSFGLINDRGHNFIMLMPIKRFSPGISVYFPDEVGEEVVDILGARLPMEDMKLDALDVIVRKLRL